MRVKIDSGMTDALYQDRILPHVSRTFALTIPQLPPDLRTAVTSAYLLCRIADTIEDEPALSAAETFAFLQRFTAVVCGREQAASLARELEQRLSERTLPAERDLVRNMERVVRMTARDRKSTRLNSSHDQISYAVFCLKKKKKKHNRNNNQKTNVS